MAYLLEHTE